MLPERKMRMDADFLCAVHSLDNEQQLTINGETLTTLEDVPAAIEEAAAEPATEAILEQPRRALGGPS